MIQATTVTLQFDKQLYAKFKDKCLFYDAHPKDILTTLIIKFNNGDLNTLLDIPELPEIEKSRIEFKYNGVTLK